MKIKSLIATSALAVGLLATSSAFAAEPLNEDIVAISPVSYNQVADSSAFVTEELNGNVVAASSESQMLAFAGIESKAVSMQQAEQLSGEWIPLWAVAVIANIVARRVVAPYLVKKALPWLANAAGGAVIANYINCGKWRC